VKQGDRKQETGKKEQGSKMKHSVSELRLMTQIQIRAEMSSKMTLSGSEGSHWKTNHA
jgi:hypothetical protein